MKLRILLCALTLVLLAENSRAKDWRGIVPLKSTRAEVERRFGKPNQWGWHELKDERVSFDYSDEPCRGLYLALGRANCKCLVDKDTVMSIFVEPIRQIKFSDLNVNLTGFRKVFISPYPSVSYANEVEGINYSVDGSGEIMHISYYPSATDCEQIIRARAVAERNVWRGLTPLRSTRADVERLLGRAQRTFAEKAVYETDHEVISATYATGNCTAPTAKWNVAKDTLVELVIGQRLRFLLSRLNLDAERYERHEDSLGLDASIKVITYVNSVSGVSIRAEKTGGGPEEVISITYLPMAKDEYRMCKK